MERKKGCEPMAYRRILAIGDIHGNYQKFCTLWEKLAFDAAQDLAIFLGDYTDRGKESRAVMEWVLVHFGKPNMIFLRGNHDEMMLAALLNVEKDLWIQNGGGETVKSLRGMENLNDFLTRWAKTIQQMPLSYEVQQDGQTYWFMHAGLKVGTPLQEQEAETLLWDRNFATMDHYDGKEVVTVGHTPIPYLYYGHDDKGKAMGDQPLILDGGRRLLIDTGGFLAGGRISAIDVLTKKIWQSEALPELGGW